MPSESRDEQADSQRRERRYRGERRKKQGKVRLERRSRLNRRHEAEALTSTEDQASAEQAEAAQPEPSQGLPDEDTNPEGEQLGQHINTTA